MQVQQKVKFPGGVKAELKAGAAVTSGAELSGSIPFPTKAAQGVCWDADICPQHSELDQPFCTGRMSGEEQMAGTGGGDRHRAELNQ